MAGGGVKWRAGGVNGRREGPLRESLRSLHATPHRLFLGGGQRLRQPPACTRIRLQGDPCNPLAPPAQSGRMTKLALGCRQTPPLPRSFPCTAGLQCTAGLYSGQGGS
eukprot:scaffold9208_cov98-Isochrysis_galbana.AAC.1